MNQSKANDAVASFNDGFNCAQSVVISHCEDFGVDKKTGLKISCGLGGGMGRLQETCGAVSGAYLLIGLKYGKYIKEDEAAKEKTYAKVREFSALFKERNKTTSCRELLGIDLLNTDHQIAKEQVKKVCPKMIQDAVEIIEEMLFQGAQ